MHHYCYLLQEGLDLLKYVLSLRYSRHVDRTIWRKLLWLLPMLYLFYKWRIAFYRIKTDVTLDNHQLCRKAGYHWSWKKTLLPWNHVLRILGIELFCFLFITVQSEAPTAFGHRQLEWSCLQTVVVHKIVLFSLQLRCSVVFRIFPRETQYRYHILQSVWNMRVLLREQYG